MFEFKAEHSFYRMFLHNCIKSYVKCNGLIADVGAGENESYRYLITGYDNYITCDIVKENSPDIVGSVELLPFKENIVNNILLFNVLEHVYEYKNAIKQIYRVLKKDGTLYGLVPFMINVHGDPYDYHRYTKHALNRVLSDNHFKHVEIIEIYGIPLLLAQYISFFPLVWRFTKPLYWISNQLNKYIINIGDKSQLSRINKNVVLAIFFMARK